MFTAQKKRWITAPPMPAEVDAALTEFPPIFRQVLYNRGVMDGDSAQAYLHGEVRSDDPFLLLGMGAAVERILWAVDHHERVVVYGDYDVDGVSATALLVEVLRSFSADARP